MEYAHFLYYVYDLLRSAFDEDKQLHSQNCLSWGKSVEQLKTIFNLDTLDLSLVQFSKKMSIYYSGKTYEPVNTYKK